ncbi:MAG: histidine phosphatase family protein [Peptostreptococcaceae bacterium]
MKIYIIRHGQTEWNVEGIMQGTKDSVLTEQGKLDESINLY